MPTSAPKTPEAAGGLPAPQPNWALFLDVDGTLTEFADHPNDVIVEPRLKSALASLLASLDGALAIISGRPIDQIDSLFAPLVLPAGGLHGLECRRRIDAPIERVNAPAWLDSVRAELEAFAADRPGAWIEDKGITLALHFRTAPALEPEVRKLADRFEKTAPPGLAVLTGKMIVEFRPDIADKGSVIQSFMASGPFAGRRPVFVGDDVTDEDGFAAVKKRGGIAIRVGDGSATAADWRIPSVGESQRWVSDVADALAGNEDTEKK